MMKIAIIREGKTPPDSRVPLTPKQCRKIMDHQPDIAIQAQSSDNRCFSDDDYRREGIEVLDNVENSDILLGVKEVPVRLLIPEKTYFFFSHTIKKQEYNKPLLRDILKKKIRLIDYEVLTNQDGGRVIAFGEYAGMVGAHNAIWAWNERVGEKNDLPRMKDCLDYDEAKSFYANHRLPAIKIVLTGSGRVGQGAAKVLDDMGIKKVSPKEFLETEVDQCVYTQLDCEHYAARKDGAAFSRQYFYAAPQEHVSQFSPYSRVADIFINGIYWDNQAPAFFSLEDIQSPDFRIRVIADVTCDIAPLASVPCTTKASTIADPLFGFHTERGETEQISGDDIITMMTIDNLPNELPRDASEGFGEQFLAHVLPSMIREGFDSELVVRGTVADRGELGRHFGYLQEWVNS